MLENGFKIGNAEVESPEVYPDCDSSDFQIIANVASSSTGCSADRIDEVLTLCREELIQKHLK